MSEIVGSIEDLVIEQFPTIKREVIKAVKEYWAAIAGILTIILAGGVVTNTQLAELILFLILSGFTIAAIVLYTAFNRKSKIKDKDNLIYNQKFIDLALRVDELEERDVIKTESINVLTELCNDLSLQIVGIATKYDRYKEFMEIPEDE